MTPIMRTAQKTPHVVRVTQIDGVTPTTTRRYTAGRTCEAPGCETALSVYNPATMCWVHEDAHPFVARADRTSSADEPRLIEPTELRELLMAARTHQHPEPGPEPSPAPPPPPPVPQGRPRGRG
jgi:hypothetical protein